MQTLRKERVEVVFHILEAIYTLITGFKARFRINNRAAFLKERYFVNKRTTMQLLSEFIEKQMMRLVGVDVSRLEK